MTIQEYTLTDLEDKLTDISNVSLFLTTGACPEEIASRLHEHMHEQIENLQGMMSHMRLYPLIKAEELAKVEQISA
jgi:hypothetical protein